MPAVPNRKRGRPLDPEIDDAIVRAAVAMLLEGGIQRMTVPGVAAAAGVAKTTVYRRYATPTQLALAAIGRLNAGSPDPDTGSARTDLIATLRGRARSGSTRPSPRRCSSRRRRTRRSSSGARQK